MGNGNYHFRQLLVLFLPAQRSPQKALPPPPAPLRKKHPHPEKRGLEGGGGGGNGAAGSTRSSEFLPRLPTSLRTPKHQPAPGLSLRPLQTTASQPRSLSPQPLPTPCPPGCRPAAPKQPLTSFAAPPKTQHPLPIRAAALFSPEPTPRRPLPAPGPTSCRYRCPSSIPLPVPLPPPSTSVPSPPPLRVPLPVPPPTRAAPLRDPLCPRPFVSSAPVPPRAIRPPPPGAYRCSALSGPRAAPRRSEACGSAGPAA